MTDKQLELLHRVESRYGSISKANETDNDLIELRKSLNIDKSGWKINKKIINMIDKFALKPEYYLKDKLICDLSEMISNGYSDEEISSALNISKVKLIATIGKYNLRKKTTVYTIYDDQKLEDKTQKSLKKHLHDKFGLTYKKMESLPFYQVIQTRKVNFDEAQ